MDANRFDTITKAMSPETSRRRTLGGLFGGALGLLGLAETTAKKGKTKKGKKRNKGGKQIGCRTDSNCSRGQVCHQKPDWSGRKCGPRCYYDRDCGSDSLLCVGGGNCVANFGECEGDADCPQGGIQYACDEGKCVFVCLYDSDCQPGQTCLSNRCA